MKVEHVWSQETLNFAVFLFITATLMLPLSYFQHSSHQFDILPERCKRSTVSINGNQTNDEISIKNHQRLKSVHVKQTRWAKFSSFQKHQVVIKANWLGKWRGEGGVLSVTPSDKRDFMVNCETLLSFSDRDGWREKLLHQFVYSNIDPYSAAVT